MSIFLHTKRVRNFIRQLRAVGAPQFDELFQTQVDPNLPIYWITFLIFLATWLLVSTFRQEWKFTFLQLIKDVFLLPQEAFPLVAVAWSLQFEEFFYILFSSFIWRKAAGTLIFVAWLIAILLVNFNSPVDHADFWKWFFLNGMNLQFIAGVALGFYVRTRKSPLQPTKNRILLPTLAGTAAVFLVLMARRNGGMPNLPFLAGDFSQRLLAGAGSTAILWGLYPVQSIGSKFAKYIFHVGRSSYSIYIIHAFALELLSIVFGKWVTSPVGAYFYFALSTCAATGLGLLFFKFVEVPSTRFARNRFASTKRRFAMRRV